MIQASELRIGNYIYNEVQEINFKACSVVIHRLSHGDSEGYKPIELTKEILLKCKNIEQKEGSLGIYYFIKPYESLRFFFDGTQLVIIKKDKGNIWIANKTYLHSFQNLFFELTGEELEINF